MGTQIVSLFEQAARVGGLRAKVRLAELTQTPTALASLVPDSDERLRDFERHSPRSAASFQMACTKRPRSIAGSSTPFRKQGT
jgi:hypothetical protein